ncbi:MAG: hypothetical protein AB1330_01495 [Bacillota bacterium]
MSKKTKATAKEITFNDLAGGLAKAMANLKRAYVQVSEPFARSNGRIAYAVTVADVTKGSGTLGFSATGFATETERGLLLREFAQLRINTPSAWKRLAEAAKAVASEVRDTGQAKRLVSGAFMLFGQMARNGNGVRVIARVIDAKSPFYLMSFSLFVGESKRQPGSYYVMPSPDINYGTCTFELTRRNQQMIPVIPARGEDGAIIRGEDGAVEYTQGESRWVTCVTGALDALAYVMEGALARVAAEKAYTIIQAKSAEA